MTTRSFLPALLLTIVTILLVLLAFQAPFARHLEMELGDAAYLRDFWLAEEDNGRTWRWSNAASQLVLHNAGQLAPSARLQLNLSGYRPADTPPPSIELTVNGQPLATIQAPGDFETLSFPISAAHYGAGDWLVTLNTDTWNAPNDARDLGLAVDWVELDAVGFQVPPLWTTLLLCVSVLAVWLGGTRRHAQQTDAAWSAFLRDKWFWGALGTAAVGALGLAFAREWAVYPLPLVTLALVCVFGVPLALPHWRQLITRLTPYRRGLAVTAVVLVLGAQVVFQLGGDVVLGILLALLGMLAFLFGAPTLATSDTATKPARLEWLLLGGIVLVTLFMRLYRLPEIPFGIFRDEARHGLTALRILDDPTYRPLFLGPPISQPTPYFYALAGLFQIWGANLTTLRLVSALAGAAAVPTLWLLARELFGTRVGLLAAFGLAVSAWHTSISRFAMPYAEPTMFALLGYWFLWRGLKRQRWYWFVAAGISIALAQYAAQTSKVLLLVAGALVLDALITAFVARNRPQLISVLRGIGVAVIAGIIVLLPLIITVAQDPAPYFARPEQVAIWSEPFNQGAYLPNVIADNALNYLASINLLGDPNGRHLLPGAPFFDPILAGFFLLGVVVIARTLRQPASRFVVYWYLAGLVPGILTVDAPSALRSLEAAPAAYTLAALGIVSAWDMVQQPRTADAPRVQFQRIVPIALAALLVLVLWLNFSMYFVRMYDASTVWRKFAPIPTRAGDLLQSLQAAGELPRGSVVYVPATLLNGSDDEFVLRFMTADRFTLRPFDNDSSLRRKNAAVLLPNEVGYWQVVSATEPRYRSRLDAAQLRAQTWQNRVAQWAVNAERIDGPVFPASDIPTFELWIAPQAPP